MREPSALIFLKNQPHCTHRKHNKDYAPKALRCSARGCAFAFPPRDAHRVAEDKRVGMLAEVVFYERAEMLFLFVERVAQRSLSHHLRFHASKAKTLANKVALLRKWKVDEGEDALRLLRTMRQRN